MRFSLSHCCFLRFWLVLDCLRICDFFLWVSEFSLIVFSSDRDSIAGCFYEFWFFLVVLVQIDFGNLWGLGFRWCSLSLTWVVSSSTSGTGVELASSVCGVEGADLIAPRLSCRAWRSDWSFGVFGWGLSAERMVRLDWEFCILFHLCMLLCVNSSLWTTNFPFLVGNRCFPVLIYYYHFFFLKMRALKYFVYRKLVSLLEIISGSSELLRI